MFIILFSGDCVDVLRGTWFYHNNQEPIDDCIAHDIETEHVKRFSGKRIEPEPPTPTDPKQAKNAKPKKEGKENLNKLCITKYAFIL